MEVITFHVDLISRNKGRSAVQMAAYCARAKLSSMYTGRTHDYTNRHDLVFHEIMLPDNAPDAFYDQEFLWNNVEQIESSRNSRLARIIYFTLPKELDREIQIEMVLQYVREYFVQRGMCADVSIHDKGDGNPHVHVLLTTRSLDADGNWMCKQRRNYLLDKNGDRIPDPVTGRYKLGKSIKTNDWDESRHVEEWRKAWADACNFRFHQHSIDKRVTHMSYARQGIDREPTKHLGAKVKAMEERGILTDRSIENHEINARNQKRSRDRLRHHIARSHERDWERDR